MATRNIVPRATGEGSIGTSAKTWGAVYADDIAVTNSVTASDFVGDLTGSATMTGDLVLSGAAIINAANDSSTLICGGTSDATYGAFLRLHGKNSSSAGLWGIRADNGTNNATLTGNPNGTLTWDGKPVERVDSKSLVRASGYIRYAGGLQMCWGDTTVGTTGKAITYAQPFASSPRLLVSGATKSAGVGWSSNSSTGATLESSANSQTVAWLAIGDWS